MLLDNEKRIVTSTGILSQLFSWFFGRQPPKYNHETSVKKVTTL